MSKITLYHGSDVIVKTPNIEIGNSNNDYGRGFYCTEDAELGREWACSKASKRVRCTDFTVLEEIA